MTIHAISIPKGYRHGSILNVNSEFNQPRRYSSIKKCLLGVATGSFFFYNRGDFIVLADLFVNSIVITDRVVCAHKEKQPEGGLVKWVQG